MPSLTVAWHSLAENPHTGMIGARGQPFGNPEGGGGVLENVGDLKREDLVKTNSEPGLKQNKWDEIPGCFECLP